MNYYFANKESAVLRSEIVFNARARAKKQRKGRQAMAYRMTWASVHFSL